MAPQLTSCTVSNVYYYTLNQRCIIKPICIQGNNKRQNVYCNMYALYQLIDKLHINILLVGEYEQVVLSGIF